MPSLGLGLGFARGASFNPSSLFTSGSRGFFYDFSDYSTQFTDTAGATAITGVGQSLARVNDKSGLGNHATQATAGNRALTTTIGTGFRGVQFDGVDDFLQTAAIDFSNSDKMTVVAGVRKLSDAARGVLIELGNTAGINAFVLDAPGTIPASELYRFVSGGSTIAIAAAASASFAAPSTVVQTGIGNISGDSSTLRLNGTQVAQITTDQGTGNYANDIVYIGRRGGATLPFNGVLTFLCVINRTLTAGELAALEAYANSRTGAY